MSNSQWPRGLQLTSLLHPWDFPGKNTGVGCHCLLQCMKVKSESDVAHRRSLFASSCLSLTPPSICYLSGRRLDGERELVGNREQVDVYSNSRKGGGAKSEKPGITHRNKRERQLLCWGWGVKYIKEVNRDEDRKVGKGETVSLLDLWVQGGAWVYPEVGGQV